VDIKLIHSCKNTHDPRKTRQIKSYLEIKENMESKQYENFMHILRKDKNPAWTSEQLNFIVGSKTIIEKSMDTNLHKIGINQKNKKKIKDVTDKTNIHSLLNILKAYYANVHQDKPKPVNTDSGKTTTYRRHKTNPR
jgi:hypothetical protein